MSSRIERTPATTWLGSRGAPDRGDRLHDVGPEILVAGEHPGA